MDGGLALKEKQLKFGLLLVFSFLVFFNLHWLLKCNPEVVQPEPVSLLDPKALHHCPLQPLSAEEEEEERKIIRSTAWPNTIELPHPFQLQPSSDPAHSRFTIIPEPGERRVGGHLAVNVHLMDFRGRPKLRGGDLLSARLHSPEINAAVVGTVLDHFNGSYLVEFPLLWSGTVHVEVKLVHSSEAITVLQRLTAEHPDRVFFVSTFMSGLLSETTNCSICLPPTRPLCNYTDVSTGDPWFCYKPTNLDCDSRVSHYKAGFSQSISDAETTLFQDGVNVKASIQAEGPSSVNVLPSSGERTSVVRAAGFYFRGYWQALSGPTVHHDWGPSNTSSCLANKVVHIFGDSTVRQLYNHILHRAPGLQHFVQGDVLRGPFIAIDETKNTYLSYSHHAVPVHLPSTPFNLGTMRAITKELDRVSGGPRTVVVIGIWAHLTTFSLKYHIRRLLVIRRAVKRLLKRAPGTKVIIRTANPKDTNLYTLLTNSDWYCLQRDQALRQIFSVLDVQFLDAWEMMQAHPLPDIIHPQEPILANMVDVLFSYIC